MKSFWIFIALFCQVHSKFEPNIEFPWLRRQLDLRDKELKSVKHEAILHANESHGNNDEFTGNWHMDMRKMRKEAMSINLEDGIPEAFQKSVTKECLRDFTRYANALSNDTDARWALMMFDATGFWDPGVLDGNTQFEGRYELCDRIEETPTEEIEFPIHGMYCLAYWWQAYPNIFSDFWWKRGQGICIPDTCTNQDAKTLIDAVYTKRLPWYADVKIHCERGKPNISEDAAAIVSIVILSLFGLLTVVATLYQHFFVLTEDEIKEAKQNNNSRTKTNKVQMKSFKPNIENGESSQSAPKEPEVDYDDSVQETQFQGSTRKKPFSSLNFAEKLLLAFSMYVNVPLITTSSQAKGMYKCLNGIRFLAMGWIVLGHTFILGTIETPSTLENEFVGYAAWSKLIYTKLMTIDVYVDTFFILSAFLMSLSFLRKLKRTNGKLGVSGWIMHYFSRYWRLTPTYMIVLMIYTNFWHYFGTGPYMKLYVGDVDSCETSWWTNLLYINNLYLGHGWCMGWSWYLCIDWQLYCIAPLFLYTLWWKEWLGICLNVAGFFVGIVSTRYLKNQVYTQTVEYGDPGYVDDFIDIYIKPWCRCSVYFMGMGLGYLYYKYDGKIRMHWAVVCIGWIVALAMYLMVSYLPYTSTQNPWTSEGSTAYYTLNRVMWGIWVCWLILACSMGYGGFVNTFLSWKFFVPLGKLTYMGYLIHPILTFLYFYGSPIQQYYYDYFFVYLFVANMMLIHIFSLMLAITVSAPLMGIISVFIPSLASKDRR